MYEKWPWTIEKTYIASLCKQHLIAFDEESDQFCKWVLLQEKCLARHRKLPGEAQHMWNAAVHGIGDVWLDCKCLTYENFFWKRTMKVVFSIILLKSLASSWFKIPEETPTLQSNSAFAKFTVYTKGRCTLIFSLKCLKPVATSHSYHVTHIMHDLFFHIAPTSHNEYKHVHMI